MSTVQVRGITVSQTTAFGSKTQEVVATQVGTRYKRDTETHQVTDEVDGYNINVRTPKTGEIQTVKLPAEVKPIIDQIGKALKDDLIPWVSFKGTFKGKFWAMLGDNGRINMGLSATATTLELIKIESFEDDCDDFNDDVIM